MSKQGIISTIEIYRGNKVDVGTIPQYERIHKFRSWVAGYPGFYAALEALGADPGILQHAFTLKATLDDLSGEDSIDYPQKINVIYGQLDIMITLACSLPCKENVFAGIGPAAVMVGDSIVAEYNKRRRDERIAFLFRDEAQVRTFIISLQSMLDRGHLVGTYCDQTKVPESDQVQYLNSIRTSWNDSLGKGLI